MYKLLPELCDAGLNAIEAYHSDHGPADVERYLKLAEKYGLLVTGGSDFHGAVKPGVRLGTGCDGNLRVPRGSRRKTAGGGLRGVARCFHVRTYASAITFCSAGE